MRSAMVRTETRWATYGRIHPRPIVRDSTNPDFACFAPGLRLANARRFSCERAPARRSTRRGRCRATNASDGGAICSGRAAATLGRLPRQLGCRARISPARRLLAGVSPNGFNLKDSPREAARFLRHLSATSGNKTASVDRRNSGFQHVGFRPDTRDLALQPLS